MKHLFLKSKLTLTLLTLILVSACSSDDDSVTIQSPSVSYAATTLDATFFQSGNTAAPTLNWNGNQGNFSLNPTINGLSINSTTGVITWTNSLPMGTHNVQAVASNSAGQTIVNITINNPLQGIFTGTYDNTYFFEIELNTDGTLLLRVNDQTNPDLATGTWSVVGTDILIDYTYDIGGDYSLLGSITQNATSVTYAGNWFYDHGATTVNLGGVFEMILD